MGRMLDAKLKRQNFREVHFLFFVRERCRWPGVGGGVGCRGGGDSVGGDGVGGDGVGRRGEGVGRRSSRVAIPGSRVGDGVERQSGEIPGSRGVGGGGGVGRRPGDGSIRWFPGGVGIRRGLGCARALLQRLALLTRRRLFFEET